MIDLSTLTILVHATPEFRERVQPDLQDGRWTELPPVNGEPMMLGETHSEAAFETWVTVLDYAGIGYEIPQPSHNQMADGPDERLHTEISVGRGPGAGEAL